MSSGKGDFYFSLTLSLFCAAVFCMSFSFPPEAAIFRNLSAVLSSFRLPLVHFHPEAERRGCRKAHGFFF